jgi:hypothetical protein
MLRAKTNQAGCSNAATQIFQAVYQSLHNNDGLIRKKRYGIMNPGETVLLNKPQNRCYYKIYGCLLSLL